MKEPISITAISSISPLGTSKEETWASYQDSAHCFQKRKFDDSREWIAPLRQAARKEIEHLRNADAKYKNLDDSVLYALYASRKAVEQAGWSLDGPHSKLDDHNRNHNHFGINIGSSRGATTLFEKYHGEYLRDNRAATLSSPTTTLGNISSWVAHDLQTQGPEISHSITCSTALHALLNGVAWIKSGMTNRFLVGGSEAPLTPFTIAQMKALKIYSDVGREMAAEVGQDIGKTESRQEGSHDIAGNANWEFPCQALNLSKTRNTMVLGEGASVACLERGVPENALAVIEGIGYATEPLRHNTSISTDAQCFQRSMRMALGSVKPEAVDALVMHAPGTVKGDISEYRAIQKVFGNDIPALTTNKWKIGHSFGASGMLSVELAILMFANQKLVQVPFIDYSTLPKEITKVMVNAVGFGGNAVSILLKLPPKYPAAK
ncbi:MAG TPA: beta-ketoacyl synthase N-terminal-like domain-containing protein [Pricia sp.]|nr:beta-ketoacyl synthase N-terminal-like domain-containing protein [Pricia sp.]